MSHHAERDAIETLTPRERDVQELLRAGLTDAEIAGRLDVSNSTIEKHVSQIIAKLGVRNRYEAAAWPERPPWWMAAVSPFLFWRNLGFGWLPGLAAGVVILPLAIGLGLLLWGLLRTGGGNEGGPATSEGRLPEERTDPLSGILYVRTQSQLIRVDLARRTAEPRELQPPQFGLHETAVAAGNHLVLASVSRSEDEWIVTLQVLDGATGREQNRIVLDPLREVPPVPYDDQDRFDDVAHSIRIWYVPQTQKLLVGIAIFQTETTSFRLDIIDIEHPVQRRSIALGDTQGRGDIHVAMEMAGNVAVLLTSSLDSRLLASSPDLSSFEAVDGAISDCSISDAASSYRSEARYFLCLSQIADTIQFQASMLVVENTKGVRRYRLPERIENLQVGTADAGDRVFIGNPATATVLAFDLATGEIVAQRQFELASASSWRERLKRFIFGQPAFARLVAFRPIVASPDGKRIFLTDGFTALWCIRPDDLSIAGQVELVVGSGVSVLGMTADGAHLIAAGGAGIEIVNGAQCRSEDAIFYSADSAVTQILVP